MGANERAMCGEIIVPGASPLIITGLRQAFLRAWIAVIGAIGFIFERLVFGTLERTTGQRWAWRAPRKASVRLRTLADSPHRQPPHQQASGSRNP